MAICPGRGRAWLHQLLAAGRDAGGDRLARPPAPAWRVGGGARAAYQVGVLSALQRMRREAGITLGNPFPVVCGTSAGAINAAVLACQADDFDQAVDNLMDVWSQFHVHQVYRSELLDMFSAGARWLSLLSFGWLLRKWQAQPPNSLLDNAPLVGLLHTTRSQAQRIGKLTRDDDETLRNHAEWDRAKYLFNVWRRATGHPLPGTTATTAVSPPIASIRFHTVSTESLLCWVRTSLYRVPPAQSGSEGSGSDGVPGTDASLQRVSTLASLIFTSASFTAVLKSVSPFFGSGTRLRISEGLATTSFLRLDTKRLASV